MNELADKSDDEGSRVCFLRIGRDPRWFRHIREREDRARVKAGIAIPIHPEAPHGENHRDSRGIPAAVAVRPEFSESAPQAVSVMCLGNKPHWCVACNRFTEFGRDIRMAMQARKAMQRMSVVRLDQIDRVGLRRPKQPDAQCSRSRPSKLQPVIRDIFSVDAYDLTINDFVQMLEEGHLVHRWNRLPEDVSLRKLQ